MHNDLNYPSIEARDLGVELAGREVLRGISFSLKPGEQVAVVGPNGAGKTTLLRALMGLVPRRGDVVLHGRGPRPAAFVAQRSDLDLDFPATVLQLISCGRRSSTGRHRWRRRADRQATERALARVGLDGLQDRGLRELSGGQLQRAFLARALVQDADILLLDEPFAAVDSETVESICELLNSLASEQRTILTVSHDLPLVRTHFDRCLTMNRTLISDGHPDEVLRSDELERLIFSR